MEGFKDIDELIENITRGNEIEFIYDKKKYSITHSELGIHIMEFDNYDSQIIYETCKNIGEYIINGKKLSNIINNLEILFRSS